MRVYFSRPTRRSKVHAYRDHWRRSAYTIRLCDWGYESKGLLTERAEEPTCLKCIAKLEKDRRP